MAAVALYVEAVEVGEAVTWAYRAPETGHKARGMVPGSPQQLGRYLALLEGLAWAEGGGYTNVLVHSSDPLFIAQLLHEVPVEDPKLLELWQGVKDLEARFNRVLYFRVSPERGLDAGDAGPESR